VSPGWFGRHLRSFTAWFGRLSIANPSVGCPSGTPQCAFIRIELFKKNIANAVRDDQGGRNVMVTIAFMDINRVVLPCYMRGYTPTLFFFFPVKSSPVRVSVE
jgi:hypothetical protein